MKNSQELVTRAIVGDTDAWEELKARIDELERAVGAASMALLLDMLRDGQNPADAHDNSAYAMVSDAAGLSRSCTPEELTAFRVAYFERFAPKGGEA